MLYSTAFIARKTIKLPVEKNTKATVAEIVINGNRNAARIRINASARC
jgi:hypothetical protein